METLEEKYEVQYGAKVVQFASRELAEEHARKQAVLPIVQRLRNGNGSMDALCEILLNARDDMDIALADIGSHIKKYVLVK